MMTGAAPLDLRPNAGDMRSLWTWRRRHRHMGPYDVEDGPGPG